jgi:pimeloyl-ACP methyl ester carboxylesterase
MPESGLPPERPSWREERPAAWLFRSFGPRLPRVPESPPPHQLQPCEPLLLPGEEGALGATFFPATAPVRGAILFVHPWVEWGQAYFFRRGRLEAVRRAGFDALTFDLGGFGRSLRRPGFQDREVERALDALLGRAQGRPVCAWGVSAGGYWAHPVLARRREVAAAVFEDVSPHLLEWSRRVAPFGRPAYAFFEHAFRRSYAFLDMRRHAPALAGRPTAYVSGALDEGVRPEDTRRLAELAGAEACVVADAPHLGAIKRAPEQVLELALATFARGLGGG